MRKVEKQEIRTLIGPLDHSKPTPLIGSILYLGGLSQFDNHLSALTTVYPHEQGYQFVLSVMFTNYRHVVKYDEIDFITIEPQQIIKEKKEKSIIGRALLGGILLGPVGAVVGGMTGIGTKEVKSKLPDNIFILKLKGSDSLYSFSVKDSDYNTVYNFFKVCTPETFRKPEDVVDVLHGATESPITKQHFSVADELRKLKSLVDDGLLTNEEFESQKKKLLSN